MPHVAGQFFFAPGGASLESTTCPATITNQNEMEPVRAPLAAGRDGGIGMSVGRNPYWSAADRPHDGSTDGNFHGDDPTGNSHLLEVAEVGNADYFPWRDGIPPH